MWYSFFPVQYKKEISESRLNGVVLKKAAILLAVLKGEMEGKKRLGERCDKTLPKWPFYILGL